MQEELHETVNVPNLECFALNLHALQRTWVASREVHPVGEASRARKGVPGRFVTARRVILRSYSRMLCLLLQVQGWLFLVVPPSLVLIFHAAVLVDEAWGLERRSALPLPCRVPRSWRRFAIFAADVRGHLAIPGQDDQRPSNILERR